MHTRQHVASQLRAAATEIQNLTDAKAIITSERDELLLKVASLEKDQISDPSDVKHETALQKEAEEGFSFRSGNGFGSSADDLPTMSSDLSAEQRLDMILNGESPSDFE